MGSTDELMQYGPNADGSPLEESPAVVKWTGKADAFVKEPVARIYGNGGTVDVQALPEVSFPATLRHEGARISIKVGDVLTVQYPWREGVVKVWRVKAVKASMFDTTTFPRVKCYVEAM